MKRRCIDSVIALLGIAMVLAVMAGTVAGPWMARQVPEVDPLYLPEEPTYRAKTGPTAVPIDHRPSQMPDFEAFTAGGANQTERGRFELP